MEPVPSAPPPSRPPLTCRNCIPLEASGQVLLCDMHAFEGQAPMAAPVEGTLHLVAYVLVGAALMVGVGLVLLCRLIW